MELNVMFVLTEEAFDEGWLPEAVLVWDEICMEANPEGFAERVNKRLKGMGPRDKWAVLKVRVPDKALNAVFHPETLVESEVLGTLLQGQGSTPPDELAEFKEP